MNVLEDVLVHDSKLKNNSNMQIVFMNGGVPGMGLGVSFRGALLYDCLASKHEGGKKGLYTRMFRAKQPNQGQRP